MWSQILKNQQKLKKITEAAFNAIDFNNNGRIEKTQLQSIMKITAQDLGIQKPSKQQIKDVLKQLDSQNKGYLSKEDFSMLTQQVIKLIYKNEQI